MDVFDLAAKIKLDSSEYDKGLSDASSRTSSFGSKLSSGLGTAAKVGAAAVTAVATATVAAGTALFNGAKATAEYGDHIDKMSQKIGMSAESYQKWDFVLQQNGASIDSLQMSMKTLSTQAQNNAEEFTKLGISEEELQNSSPEELFEKTVAALQNMEEGTERTAIASKLLGRSATELGPLFNQTAEATEALKKQAEDYGLVMSDDAVKASAAFSDSLNLLQMTMTGMKNRAMGEFLPAITEITDGLALLFTGDTSGVDQINQGISDVLDSVEKIMPTVLEVGESIISNLAQVILDNLPQIIDTATQIIFKLLDGLVSALPALADGALQIIEALIRGLIDNLPQILQTGLQVIIQLAKGIAEALPELIPAIVDILLQIVNTLIENIDLLIDCALLLIEGLANGLIQALPILCEKAPELIIKLVDAFTNNIDKIIDLGIKLIVELAKGLIQATPQLVACVPKLVTSLINYFKTLYSKFGEVGKNIVDGLWKGIQNGWTWLTDKVKGLVDKLVSGVKSTLGIHSPSKVFAGIGGFMAEGLDEGWSDEFKDVQKDINNDLNFDTGQISVSAVTNNQESDIIKLLREYLPQIGKNQIVMNTGELVGATVNAMDEALGKRMQMQARFI